MKVSTLRALSPADGRYSDKVADLRDIFSEYGLIRHRVLVEVRWLQCLADEPDIAELEPLSSVMKDVLNHIVDDFSLDEAERVKAIESTTNHDVKAIEYFIREKLGEGPETDRLRDFLHFGCTSEDINNLSYALMLRAARSEVLLPMMRDLQSKLRSLAHEHADLAMLSRTHGQTASPTTLGKELANVVSRLDRAPVGIGVGHAVRVVVTHGAIELAENLDGGKLPLRMFESGHDVRQLLAQRGGTRGLSVRA